MKRPQHHGKQPNQRTRPARRILYLQFANPGGYPPLLQSARILADTGWQVFFLGVQYRAPGPGLEVMHPSVRSRLIPVAGPGIWIKLAYLRFVLCALWFTLRYRPGWIYLSDPITAPLGRLLLRLGCQRLLYHEHDAPPSTGPATAFMRQVLQSRRRFAQQAAIAIAPNHDRAALLQASTGRTAPVQVVWNCPHSFEARVPGQPRPADDDFWLLYQGSINLQRLPPTLIRALRQTHPAIKLCIAGYVTTGDEKALDTLFALAEQQGVRDRIRHVGSLPRTALLECIGRCDLGLALFPLGPADVNLHHMIGASNKVFDYLACGVPVLAAGREDWSTFIEGAGVGWVCNPDDEGSLVTLLDRCLAERQQLAAMGERGRQRVLSEWNYEQQFAPVLAALEQQT